MDYYIILWVVIHYSHYLEAQIVSFYLKWQLGQYMSTYEQYDFFFSFYY